MAWDTIQAPSTGKSKYPEGVFVDEVEIVSAENQESEWKHCNVKIEAKSEKGKYPNRFWIGGNHFEEKGKFTEWGQYDGEHKVDGIGSWTVKDFLIKIGAALTKDMIQNDGGLSEETLRDMIGRRFIMLTYESNGKYSRGTWFKFSSTAEGKDDLLSKWNNRKKSPKDYAYADTKAEISNGLSHMMNGITSSDKTAEDDSLDFLNI